MNYKCKMRAINYCEIHKATNTHNNICDIHIYEYVYMYMFLNNY